MEYELRTTFNDVNFIVYYESSGMNIELNSVLLAADQDGHSDLVNMLSDTVLQGLLQACVSEEYGKLDEELERIANR